MSLRDKIRNKLFGILTLDRSPKVIALSSFLGMLIGLSPYVGFHTYIALLVSGWFKLPVYPLIIGAYITNPLTIPFIYSFTTMIGLKILGRSTSFHFDWHNLTLHSVLEAGKELLLPFIIGTHIVGLIFSIITYIIVYYAVKIYRKK